MIKFQINKFIELRLENGRSNIYLDNQYFRQSKYIILKRHSLKFPEGLDSVKKKLTQNVNKFLNEDFFENFK
jgi:hypothetical protein